MRIIWEMDDTEYIKNEFLNLKTRQDVADIIGISDSSLRYFLYAIRPDNMYIDYNIKKRNGGIREISSPNNKLKNIQKKLVKILNCVYQKKPSAYGFVEGRNIVQNAERHCKQKVVLNIDLKNFFSQIHFGRIQGMFTHKPYEIGVEAAMVIAQIACYNGKLPQGAPTSPILSNMICAPLDTQLTKLAKKYHLLYSRYADDITFSTHKDFFPTAIVKQDRQEICLGEELLEIISRNSFEINYNKVYIRNRTQRQEVTGLTVNKFPNLKRMYLKSIRAMIYNCKQKGVFATAVEYVEKGCCDNNKVRLLLAQIQTEKDEQKKNVLIKSIEEWFKGVLKGKVNFIKQVRGENDTYFLKYAKEINSLFQESIITIVEKNSWEQQSKKWCFIVEDKDGNMVQGSGFLLKDYGIITNYHVVEDDTLFYNVLVESGDRRYFINANSSRVYDEDIDYVLYNDIDRKNEGWILGDSSSLKIGSFVRLIGFPDYNKGDSMNVIKGEITGKRRFMGQEVFTVSSKIVHGASGGVVLNEDNKVVGVIRVGSQSFDESENDDIIPSIIPINNIIENINRKQSK